MTARLVSAIYFMLDAFIISMVLVFVSSETALPVVWIWLLAAMLMACSSYFLFSKKTYRVTWVVGIALVAAAVMWTGGMALWLALILSMLSVYLLHVRYSVRYEGFNHGSQFLMKFLVVFSIIWVILLLNPEPLSSRLLFTLVPVAVLFYVALHLVYSYLHSKADGARFSQVVGAFGTLAILPAVAAIGIFWIADEVRSLAGWAVGGVIKLLFWPLALVLEQVTEFLSALSTEEEMQETIEKLGPDAEAVQNDLAVSEAVPTDFPVEIFLGIAVLACAIALVYWVRKIKPDSQEPVEENKVSITRHDHASVEQLVPRPAAPHSQNLDLHQIREAFRELEMLATEQQVGRKKYETVREWTARLHWDVTDSFFKTYDRVRYGDMQLPDSQAMEFIGEITEIKRKYLNEHV